MKYNTFKPRGGAIVFLCIAVAALWMIAVYGTYEDSVREKYEVVIKPGEVVYGTHSSAVVPMTVTTSRPDSEIPRISASAVRSYAHYGHSAMPATTHKGMHTTSSAKVHTISSGTGNAGGQVASGAQSSSQRGIVYGSPSIALPTLAMNSTRSSVYGSPAMETASQYRGVGRRRAKPNRDGEDGETAEDDEITNKWWYWDGEDWAEVIPNVTERINNGVVEVFNGTEWVPKSGGDWENPTPVGATPWLMMLALGLVYATRKRIRGLVG